MQVLVIGDVMIDESVSVEFVKRNPENEGNVYRAVGRTIHAGGAALAAIMCRIAGLSPTLYGVTNTDYYGNKLNEILMNQKIFGVIRSPFVMTTVKVRYSTHQDRFDFEDEKKWLPVEIEDEFIRGLTAFDTILISDYGKGVCSPSIVRAAIKSAKRVFVDPASGVDWIMYKGASLIKSNLSEAQGEMPGVDKGLLAPRLYVKHSCPVVVTDGGNGMFFANDKGFGHVEAKKVRPTKVYGAGDAAFASITASIINDVPLKEACQEAANFVLGQICPQAE